MAVSSDKSLSTGPEPLEGLRHGVPVQGPHHLHDLWDRLRSYDVRLYIDPVLRDVTYKIFQRVATRRAGRPDLLLPNLRETLLEPVQRCITCLRHELTSPQSIKCVSQVLWHRRSYYCFWNSLSPAPETKWACAGVPGDELLQVGTQDVPLAVPVSLVHFCGRKNVSAGSLEVIN